MYHYILIYIWRYHNVSSYLISQYLLIVLTAGAPFWFFLEWLGWRRGWSGWSFILFLHWIKLHWSFSLSCGLLFWCSHNSKARNSCLLHWKSQLRKYITINVINCHYITIIYMSYISIIKVQLSYVYAFWGWAVWISKFRNPSRRRTGLDGIHHPCPNHPLLNRSPVRGWCLP